ncbi:hypothetical protein C479_03201 [Halovivax asiaticus JCM 14624]|uniref:DUF7974 domain-containing protein n=1 Tax=Halovivax asiaticus JCM 14624 TaxID=1227490 RepID=M0BVX6_9EURY|nr:hypothetical protein [Halovivax asiaticus]ELZ13819.1 hypothetical protein C479_03201 [Halovivax asiaticus JCM 14624]
MRRIYESNALERETGPFTPNERSDSDKGPSVPDDDDAGFLGTLIPNSISTRAIAIDISTPKEVYTVGEPIHFSVEVYNRMPFGVSIQTPTPLLWKWEVDDYPNAAHADLDDPPADTSQHTFSGDGRKRFDKRWLQRFQRSKSEWERAEPGTYTLRARVNVPGSERAYHSSETDVEIVEENN